jgi:ATP-dependent helicase/nuclease subunit A
VGGRFAQGSLFVVGDTKQSIYRFRGAQPAIFAEFRKDFPAEGWASLTENFRSVPPLLDFVNALFRDTFVGDEHLLKPGPGTRRGHAQAAIEFLWAHEPDDEDADTRSVDARRKIEARWIARLISQRIGDGQWHVRDSKTKHVRPAEAGDVAILFRTLNDAAAYEAALVAEGLDYHIVGGSAFFGQQEVLDVINLLSAIEDPHDTLALAATLRGPFGCISDDALYWLATAVPGDLTAGLEKWNRLPELTRGDRKRAGRAHELLLRWRRAKDRIPIATLLDQALDESGYEAALMGEFLGPRKRANVRKLVRLARRFDAQGGFTLADFVAKLRADLRKPPREEQAATTDEESDAIRLMTIHQSKGLEFPIVILPDLNRDAPRSTRAVAFDAELGVLAQPSEDDLLLANEETGDDSPGKSLGMVLYRHREELEENEEALRLFYVAATRAQDILVLSAGMEPTDDPKSPALELLAKRFDRATGACLADLPTGWTRPDVILTLKAPSPSSTRPRAARIRPRLLKVSHAISHTSATAIDRPTIRPAKRPRLCNLDPAEPLSATAARLDRLIRTILADPAAFDASARPACILRAARLQSPVASPRLIETAGAWVEAWLETPHARQIAEAVESHRFVPWAVAWPRSEANPTVYQGMIDFLFRDAKKQWSLVTIAGQHQAEARERLRCLLSVYAARDLGIKKIRHVWRVWLGPEPGVAEEVHLDAKEIDRAIRATFAAESRLPGF